MLTTLHIRHFAIIDELEVHFTPGMTVLSGETGAGKSVLIDALTLVLGGRADAQLIHATATRCEITAQFRILPESLAYQWLQQQQLLNEDECLLRRVISREGRNTAFINGTLCSMGQLKQLAKLIINIHGQHEQQLLLDNDYQRELLDNYAANHDLRAKVASNYQQWQQLKKSIAALTHPSQAGHEKYDLLQYQLQELENLALMPDEISLLDEEHKRLTHAEKLQTQCQNILLALDTDQHPSLISSISSIATSLRELVNIDQQLNNIVELTESAYINLQESHNELRHYVDNIVIDHERLSFIEQRLANIHDIARKHHVHPEQLLTLQQQLQQQLATLQNNSDALQKLQQQQTQVLQEYQQLAATLSQSRQTASTQLNQVITTKIRELGMPHGEFALQITTQANREPNLHGNDHIEFLITTNPGQPLLPLQNIASGGELSRISLAIDVITANIAQTPSLVFDEVDTGISGGIAEMVGRALRLLSNTTQVLCITHLPQVAALANQHLKVNKSVSMQQTTVTINTLTAKQRTEEIARMLGGIQITAQTRKHAKEMLALSQA